jgi:uncharacterized protein YneF (UPF0154 family)
MLELIVIIVCLATVIFNLITVWLNQKLYTEYFKDKSISNRKP